ncbi:hypothetical protein GCK32_003002 [Trichostrongylus colubriformis]|uniref:Uncharacterized protein n=1 Tax=Trichostrongylus colubriformis TaxID=6319 RepID=A0AAN8F248_TRICO
MHLFKDDGTPRYTAEEIAGIDTDVKNLGSGVQYGQDLFNGSCFLSSEDHSMASDRRSSPRSPAFYGFDNLQAGLHLRSLELLFKFPMLRGKRSTKEIKVAATTLLCPRISIQWATIP